ncbi:phosphoribosyltransferase [Kitasatospora misakiensis]|uniref:Phosphoribosyltransferase n=1 Tax=Kitasatospora misakiensis TaxID=67330 RepID=A0ABW0XBR0_9ACTN
MTDRSGGVGPVGPGVGEEEDVVALFTDRCDAGRRLARRTRSHLGARASAEPVVVGLGPGGVAVALEVARELGAPLDVLVARPLTAPGNGTPIGALAGEEPPVLDLRVMRGLGIGPADLAAEVARQRVELHRLEKLYRNRRPPLPLDGRTAVLVTDGVLHGPLAHAAVHSLRARGPERLVLATPVCDARSAVALRRHVDALLCLHEATYLHAVGPWYADFRDVTDRDVAGLLGRQPAADSPRG